MASHVETHGGAHGHGGETLALRTQFDTEAQQRDASTFGMWVFLITEVMFFGGMFLMYTVYRTIYPEAFAVASASLNATLGAVNTAVLLCSSYTMVLAVRASQIGWQKGIVIFVLLTVVLGGVFLGVKAVEWTEKFHHHHIPGPSFHLDGTTQQGQAQLFFSLYFAMTGLHALHMVIGVGIMAVILYNAWKGVYTAKYNTPVDVAGLYWHFVDIIWIFLFPLLYLIDRHLPK